MKKGFTLVEIMIVVAIIALLIGMAVPNVLRKKCKEACANGNCSEDCLRLISQIDSEISSYDIKKFCDEQSITKKEFDNSPMLQNRFKLWVEKGGDK
jgi:prepilin-type N-terminal cleavage/methylation domain-containing protein